jgi:phosphatidylethanolamine/phosphatidyl-N-methylethanolamine N-methyltransferase
MNKKTPSRKRAPKQAKPDNKHKRKRHQFIAAWVRSPMGMGALLPSSRRLARAMVAEIDTSNPGVIIELGAGTGVMTHALLEAGIPPERLLVIERDPKLHELLVAQFPNLTVLCEDAANLQKLLISQNVTKVCAILSSIPFLTIPKPVGKAIQEQMAKVIGKDGLVVQFTYGIKSPISKKQLENCGMHAKRTKMVMTNVPPAHVWVYRQI